MLETRKTEKETEVAAEEFMAEKELQRIGAEPEASNIRSTKTNRLEVREPEKPLFDNRDMVAFLCIVCAALITNVLSGYDWFADDGIRLVISIMFFILVISLGLFFITQKIVRACHVRAKRKATDRVSD